MSIILKSIEIDNFKSFAVRQAIQLSDLSVLLGANSSGKSTALQALLAIKQTMECNSKDEDFLLSGKYVVLGDYDDVINSADKGRFGITLNFERTEQSEIELENDVFKITWEFTKSYNHSQANLDKVNVVFQDYELTYVHDKDNYYSLLINQEKSALGVAISNLLISGYYLNYDSKLNEIINTYFNILLQLLGENNKVVKLPIDQPQMIEEMDFFYRLMSYVQGNERIIETPQRIEEESLSSCVINLLDEFSELQIPQDISRRSVFSKELKCYLIEWAFSDPKKRKELKVLTNKYRGILNNYKREQHESIVLDERYYFKSLDDIDKLSEEPYQLRQTLEFYDRVYLELIPRIFFLGPIRENPKGLYNIGFEAVPKYVGPTGAYFASVLQHENKIKKYLLPREERECTLSEALAEWAVHLNIASEVDVRKDNSFGLNVLIEDLNQKKSDIMNVGIGTSQVLPVIISVLLSNPGEVLIFEQPELHLHPYSQSKLADLFVLHIKQGRKIIVETHSEHFLLRLRYYIIKGIIDKNAIAVNFFLNSNGTRVETANISGFGNIEYPDGFRDETQELLNSITDAALKRLP